MDDIQLVKGERRNKIAGHQICNLEEQ